MSENKQTLFRFKTMRAPKEVNFDDMPRILHPNTAESVFYTAVAEMTPGQNKLAVLRETAEDFTPITSVNALIAYASEMYYFGEWLFTHRKTVTAAQFAAEAPTYVALSTAERYLIWDNLFYQLVTMQSTELRNVLMKVLVADFVKLIASSLTTDEKVRNAILTRVFIPSEMIVNENAYPTATIPGTTLPNTTLLSKHMTTAERQVKTALGIKALGEVQQYRKKFYETNLPIHAKAVLDYQVSVSAAIKSGTTTVAEDEFSGNLMKRVAATIPAFSYVAPLEVDADLFFAAFSDTTFYLLEELDLLTTRTFKQVEEGLTEYIRVQQDETFRNTGFHIEKLAVNGTLLSKCSLESRYNAQFSFLMKPVKTATDTYAMLLCVDAGSSCLKLSKVSVTGDELPFELKAFEYSNKDGIVTISLAPNQPLYMEGASSTTIQIELRFSNGMVLKTSAFGTLDLQKELIGTLALESHDSTEADLFVPSGFGLTRLGVAEYRKVEQSLCCYVPGEVSHIENIMAREYKERSTRRLRRSEDTTTTTSSTEREHQTDTTSTSRFDMQQEVSSVLSETRENSQDVSGHGGYSKDSKVFGNVEASTDFASNHTSGSSQEQSESQSVTFAKEITEKALDRVVSKVSTERVNKIIEEFEEQNRHGFDNRKGAEHISGVYRWVDKIYKNQVVNYGKRLQYEFMIPEPASFHIIAKNTVSDSGAETPLKKPLDPRSSAFGTLNPITHAALLTENNYQQWAAAYNATVLPPPDAVKVVGKSLIRPQDDSAWSVSKVVNDLIELPEGYGIKRIYLNALGNGDNSNWERYYVSVGGTSRVYWTGVHERYLHAESTTYPELDSFTDAVPVAVQFTGLDGGIVTVEIELARKANHYAEWQIETFNAVISAYEDRLAAYKNALAEVATQQGKQADNPAYLRRIENTVLKKNCIAYLIGHLNMGKSFVTNGDMANAHVQLNAEMDRYAATVKFFEQAFEWDLMEYRFYPFYWGDRAKWGQFYGRDNDDALFRSFLQSGMARTIVTVRPGFEEAVMFYLATGLIWNGGLAPVIGDPLYVSVVEELADPEYTIAETWESRVPSSLTLIQAKTIALNAEGLPCYCDAENPPVETIEQPATNPLENLEVFIPGDTATDDTTEA